MSNAVIYNIVGTRNQGIHAMADKLAGLTSCETSHSLPISNQMHNSGPTAAFLGSMSAFGENRSQKSA